MHIGHNVAISVERETDVGVPEYLLHDLGMNAAAQEQRGARVPQIVEADEWQAGTLEDRLEAAAVYVGRFERRADLRRENEILILVETTGLKLPLRLYAYDGMFGVLRFHPASVEINVETYRSDQATGVGSEWLRTDLGFEDALVARRQFLEASFYDEGGHVPLESSPAPGEEGPASA